MIPAALLRDAAADGVRMTLTPDGAIKAAGNRTAVARWMPVIRENKPGIVAALQRAANDAIPTPAAIRPVKAEPTFSQRLELTWLVSTIHSAQGDSELVIAECVQDALARPEAALECYRELLRRRTENRREAVEERAAIMEFDGGMTRPEAERAAGIDL